METETFDWTHFLAIANELATRSEEACLRTAVGRAYYFAFHLARRRLRENNFTISKGGNSHQWVWEKFSRSLDNDCKKLAQIANRLKEKRLIADYEDQYPRILEDAPLVLTAAKDFANRLALLPTGLPANTVK